MTKHIKRYILGKARSPTDPKVFHKLSLAAFLAWIGLGSDGISSSCYGPHEAFLALKGHFYLGFILALLTAVTVIVISTSYKQIIELFPSGGGGYLVASKLLSPSLGMISGCALLVDYVLTITVSISSGADAVFSLLPLSFYSYKPYLAVGAMLFLIYLNLRGIRESVMTIMPVFLLFIVTHVMLIVYALISHIGNVPDVVRQTGIEFRATASQIGFFGVALLILHAYSLGSGTYTGIEAVSNGLPILREPRVETGKRTMNLIAVSLTFMASGLILSYLLFRTPYQPGKTLNAVLLGQVAGGWPGGQVFIILALASEALILVIAAQTGFLDGPRVLSNMAMDGWMPSRFALLSDRLVTQNGILLMGGASLILLVLSKGIVSFLLVLYSINVFLTFSLSQLGMVKHWWQVRAGESKWFRKLLLNGIGLMLTSLILVMVIVLKFNEGGWLTLAVTASLVGLALLIKRHYKQTLQLLGRLDALFTSVLPQKSKPKPIPQFDKNAHTAIIMVNGFTGMGLHTLFTAYRNFHGYFKNFVFIQAGIVDAGKFKGGREVQHLKKSIDNDLGKYVEFMRSHGYYSESLASIGIDVVEEVEKVALQIETKFPNHVFFAGQLVFPKETIFTRLLHNYTAFAIQKRLYYKGIPVVILPIRV